MTKEQFSADTFWMIVILHSVGPGPAAWESCVLYPLHPCSPCAEVLSSLTSQPLRPAAAHPELQPGNTAESLKDGGLGLVSSLLSGI